MAETSQERTEEATPRRRQQARKKGTVAKSHELTGAVVIVALLGILPATISNLGQAFMSAFRTGLQNMPRDAAFSSVLDYSWIVMRGPISAFVPIVAVAMGVGLAANFAQVGFTLSGEALTPKLEKLNPLNGIKRLFGLTATMEGLKALAKFILFGVLAYTSIRTHYKELALLGWNTPQNALSTVGELLRGLSLKIGFAWLALAALDFFFQKKQVDKQLRMTKEELKQEMKEMEQSPELRAAIAQRRRRLSRRMMQAVKTADAVITNPTHYAVAIKYEAGSMHAPQVVAKGADLIAAKIREVAKESRVPIVPNPPLARTLYKKCEVGDFVPRELFQAVAEVLAYVYQTLRDVGSRRSQ